MTKGQHPAATCGRTFNEYVLQVVRSYPTDGSYQYSWTSEENYVGITQDLSYCGTQFVIGDPARRSYCSGITFEVFFQSFALYNADRGITYMGDLLTAADMEDFRLKWYGVGGDRRTIKHALESSGLGYTIQDLQTVKPGDFAQIWRASGSGHTVVFINWVYDAAEAIIGFNYWSSNSKKGIGYQTEYFGETDSAMLLTETFFMRVMPFSAE